MILSLLINTNGLAIDRNVFFIYIYIYIYIYLHDNMTNILLKEKIIKLISRGCWTFYFLKYSKLL